MPLEHNEGRQLLEQEIRIRRDDILTAFGQKYVRPRNIRISDVRHKLAILEGMVVAYCIAGGHWNGVWNNNEIPEALNDAAMIWLSVDLVKMRERAYPKKGNHNEVQGG